MRSCSLPASELKITILYIEECPNWAAAGERARTGLDANALGDVPIEFRLLRTPADAALVPFAGSPTILIDGEDPFGGDGRTSELACRVYVTPAGLAGMLRCPSSQRRSRRDWIWSARRGCSGSRRHPRADCG